MVSILVISLNSDIPTLLLTKPVIDHFTPALVDMVESIASSKELADRVSAFVDGRESTKSSKSKTATLLRGSKGVLSAN